MRKIQDALLNKTWALPAQNASTQSGSYDLGSAGDAVIEVIEVEVSVPATPSLADAQTIILSVEDSADNSTFAANEEAGQKTITGAGGSGGPATTAKFKLPSGIRRYFRIDATSSATSGDNSGVSATVKVLT